MKKQGFILFLIVILAIFLRFWQLDKVPPSASLDEVSIGYNAYSVLETGADEYGTKFPPLLRAYDDWRPALYVYLVIPFIKIFGLNVFVVRLPSVILSVLTILATYFLVRELFAKRFYLQGVPPAFDGDPSPPDGGLLTSEVNLGFPHAIALVSSFLLAISPWHIYMSRLGHEVNAGLAFFIFGLLAGFKKRIYFSAVLFSLSFASYQSEKIFLPFFLLGVAIIYREELMKIPKKILPAVLISFIILLPFLKATLEPNALMRFRGTSIFNATQKQLVGKAEAERKILQVKIVVDNYLVHFNPKWLFSNGGTDNHKIPDLGLFFWWEVPLLITGLISLMKNIKNKINQMLLFWLLAAPLPAALTTQAPHAMRTIQVLPVPQIIEALGFLSILYFLNDLKTARNKILKLFFFLFSLFFFLFSLFSLFQNYFFVFPKEQSKSFQYALKDAIGYVNLHQDKYDKIIFSNKDDLYQSYMFFLFYSQYDPILYQKQGGTISGGFAQTHKFGKYEFRPINWSKEEKNKNILYLGTTQELSEGTIVDFVYLNGTEGIRMAR